MKHLLTFLIVLTELTIYGQQNYNHYAVNAKLIHFTNPEESNPLVISVKLKDSVSVKLHTEDIVLFWKVFDQTYPAIKSSVLETEYLQKGSAGLKAFIPNRIESGKNLSKTIKKNLDYYLSIREGSLSIESKKELIAHHFRKFKMLYTGAILPDVYFVIGAKNTGGMAFNGGLSIGAEMFGNPNDKVAPRLDLELIDDVVVHELIHFQQHYVRDNSLLAQSIREGAADFLCELVTGTHSNQKIYEYGNAHEAELWKEFKERMFENNWSGWLYYQRDKARPNDLGYWMGFKITKAYYDKAENKSKAIVEILSIQDFKKFLTDSGYAGGTD